MLVLATLLFGSNAITAQSNLTCGCYNVNVTLDENCEFDLIKDLVADGTGIPFVNLNEFCLTATFREDGRTYFSAYVRVMDNDLSGDPERIDCAGVWTYGLFDRKSTVDTKDDVVICWGK
ncbi:MAG: hypothetical protein IPO07_17390 [Haliscomenobacter sp.]|nr:hypothetical protein [Haliscomenobacter sp.]MBK9490350.1 hypothetical protein [Haliscomenobacter sp.]